MATIRNRITGETKTVSDRDLPKFGIGSVAPTPTKRQEPEKPKRILGGSLPLIGGLLGGTLGLIGGPGLAALGGVGGAGAGVALEQKLQEIQGRGESIKSQEKRFVSEVGLALGGEILGFGAGRILGPAVKALKGKIPSSLINLAIREPASAATGVASRKAFRDAITDQLVKEGAEEIAAKEASENVISSIFKKGGRKRAVREGAEETAERIAKDKFGGSLRNTLGEEINKRGFVGGPTKLAKEAQSGLLREIPDSLENLVQKAAKIETKKSIGELAEIALKESAEELKGKGAKETLDSMAAKITSDFPSESTNGLEMLDATRSLNNLVEGQTSTASVARTFQKNLRNLLRKELSLSSKELDLLLTNESVLTRLLGGSLDQAVKPIISRGDVILSGGLGALGAPNAALGAVAAKSPFLLGPATGGASLLRKAGQGLDFLPQLIRRTPQAGSLINNNSR